MDMNNKEELMKAELEKELMENELIVAERFKLMLQIESMLKDNKQLDAEINIELEKIKAADNLLEIQPKFNDNPTRFFVGNLNFQVDEPKLKKYFSTFGTVIDLYVNHQRKFGFVGFSNLISEESFLEKTHIIKGILIKVKQAVPRGYPQCTTVIAFGAEVHKITDKTIKDFFAKINCNVKKINLSKRDMNKRLIEFYHLKDVALVLSKLSVVSILDFNSMLIFYLYKILEQPAYFIGNIWITVREGRI